MEYRVCIHAYVTINKGTAQDTVFGQREVILPFAPYNGLKLYSTQWAESISEYVTLSDVHWDIDAGCFNAITEISEDYTKDEASLSSWVSYFQDAFKNDGWVVAFP